MPLRTTPSKDGVDRATLRVAFRVDAYRLTLAVLYEVERVAGSLAGTCVCARIIGNMTRTKTLEAARAMFRAEGYTLDEVGIGCMDGNEQAAEKRVAELFPELA